MSKNIVLVLFLMPCVNTFAQEGNDSKKGYSLFNPVPKKLMRNMATDRPDVTESAYSVDAGHFQVESDAFKTVRNKSGDILSIQNFYNLSNLKLGLSNSTDLQLVVESYVDEKLINKLTDDKIESSSGFGNLTVRLKRNFWGNDKGKTALSIMPYLNITTKKTENSGIDGGILFPFCFKISDSWSFGAQLGTALVRNDENKQFHAEVMNSVTLGKSFSDHWEAFVESYYNYNFKNKYVDVYADGGIIYNIADNFKLDAGINYGLTKTFNNVYFAGFSFRY